MVALSFKNWEDFKNQLSKIITEWRKQGTDDLWLNFWEKQYFPSSVVWNTKRYLIAMRDMDEYEFIKYERAFRQKFEEDNQTFSEIIKRLESENKAFNEAGLKVGKVEYKCPICGRKAVASRYYYRGRIHGMGSGCEQCGIYHS